MRAVTQAGRRRCSRLRMATTIERRQPPVRFRFPAKYRCRRFNDAVGWPRAQRRADTRTSPADGHRPTCAPMRWQRRSPQAEKACSRRAAPPCSSAQRTRRHDAAVRPGRCDHRRAVRAERSPRWASAAAAVTASRTARGGACGGLPHLQARACRPRCQRGQYASTSLFARWQPARLGRRSLWAARSANSHRRNSGVVSASAQPGGRRHCIFRRSRYSLLRPFPVFADDLLSR